MSIVIRAKLNEVNHRIGEALQRQTEIEHALQLNRKHLQELQSKDSSYAALDTILKHIERLESWDSIDLLWGELSDEQAENYRQRIEATLHNYDASINKLQHKITKLQQELANLDNDHAALLAMQQVLQGRLDDTPLQPISKQKIEQTKSATPVLPWSNKRNDAIRLRVIMLTALLVSVLLGYIIPQWQITEPPRVEFIEIPERLATVIIKKSQPPPPAPQQQAQEEAEQADKAEAEPAVEADPRGARQAIEKTGLLAFKQDFAEIMDASANIRMGSQAAIITNIPVKRRKPAAHSLLTQEADFSDSGTTAVQRIDTIGDNNKLKQVEFTHIENPAVTSWDSKQLNSSKTMAQRSDEEIQVIFDRYKDALYRIYNRELRKNSFLKGKLVLQLTIEPDGNVSKCIVVSSDLNSHELEKKIIARVLRFNFGDKQGATKLTIVYPIEFLPSS